MVPISFTLRPKSTISLNRIPLLDKDAGQYNFEMICQEWASDQDKYHDRILHDPIQFGSYNTLNGIEVKWEFLRTSHLLDWAATLAPIKPPP